MEEKATLVVKVEYYMDNGTVIKDSIGFEGKENDEGLSREDIEETVKNIRELVKGAIKSNERGYVVLGTVYVDASKICAIKIEPEIVEV